MSFFSMTKIVMRSLFQRPATRAYPFVPAQRFEATRGSIAFNRETCTHCTLCAKKCPTQAIVVDRQGKLWTIDRLRCISCGACVDACAKGSLTMLNDYTKPTVTKDKEIY